MLKDLKLWVTNAQKVLQTWSGRVRWVADIIDWFITALTSLPLPKDDNDNDAKTDNKPGTK